MSIFRESSRSHSTGIEISGWSVWSDMVFCALTVQGQVSRQHWSRLAGNSGRKEVSLEGARTAHRQDLYHDTVAESSCHPSHSSTSQSAVTSRPERHNAHFMTNCSIRAYLVFISPVPVGNLLRLLLGSTLR